MLTQTSQPDYESLCCLDVLGLEDTREHNQFDVYNEFKEQLTRSPEGRYETGLPWKGNHPTLKNNRQGSLRRLTSLQTRLEKKGLTEQYAAVIQGQLEHGVIEEPPEQSKGIEFYPLHKEVIREGAATTKLRVVYDASAKPTPQDPSLTLLRRTCALFRKVFVYCIKYFVKEIFDFHGKYTVQKLKTYPSKCQSLKIRVTIIPSILRQTLRQCRKTC